MRTGADGRARTDARGPRSPMELRGVYLCFTGRGVRSPSAVVTPAPHARQLAEGSVCSCEQTVSSFGITFFGAMNEGGQVYAVIHGRSIGPDRSGVVTRAKGITNNKTIESPSILQVFG